MMEVVYLQEGQAFWKMLGRITEQQRSLIEERLKYTDRDAVKRGLGPSASRNDRGESAEPRPPADSGAGLRYARNPFDFPKTASCFVNIPQSWTVC